MASVKFEKGSEEWMMFQDFWKLCQEYWNVEDNDDYWKNLIADCDCFYKKYKEISIARNLVYALSNSLEQSYKQMKG